MGFPQWTYKWLTCDFKFTSFFTCRLWILIFHWIFEFVISIFSILHRAAEEKLSLHQVKGSLPTM